MSIRPLVPIAATVLIAGLAMPRLAAAQQSSQNGWSVSFFQGRQVSAPNIDSYYAPSMCNIVKWSKDRARSVQIGVTKDATISQISLLNSRWNWQPLHPQEAIIRIDGQTIYDANAMAGASQMYFTTSIRDFRTFEQSLAAGTTLTVEFPGISEDTWVIALAGAGSAFPQMDQCIAEMNNPQPDPNKPINPF